MNARMYILFWELVNQYNYCHNLISHRFIDIIVTWFIFYSFPKLLLHRDESTVVIISSSLYSYHNIHLFTDIVNYKVQLLSDLSNINIIIVIFNKQGL